MREGDHSARDHQMRDFEKSLRRVQPLLHSWIGAELSQRLVEVSRSEYEALIPQIPFLGDRNPLAVFFQSTPGYLAVYRAMQNLGYALDDAGYLVFEIGSQALKVIPGVGRKMIGYLWFSSWFKERVKRRSVDTHLRRYPGNFVLNFIDGDGESFDYGVDYLECASCKFLQAQGALELTPYVCAVDKTASELLGWGLCRTTTLADGSSKCDFRFTKGGRTDINMPEALLGKITARENRR